MPRYLSKGWTYIFELVTKESWKGFHEYEMWRKTLTTLRGIIRSIGPTFLGFLRSFVENKGLLWIFVLGISGWSTVSILVLLKHRYETDSTTIGVSTAYSRWINTFPSIGICITKYRAFNEFKAMMRDHFQEEFEYSFTKMIYEFAFTNPNTLFTRAPTKNTSYPYDFDILEIRRKMFPTNCSACFEEVYFRGELVANCEEIFKFHVTEMGYCFLANNLLDYDSIDEMPLRYSSLDNNRNLRLILRYSVFYKYEMYVNSPEDLPFFNSLTYTISNDSTTYAFNVEEIHNHEGVIDEPISQRKCKFPSETSVKGFPYSFSACMSIIRSEFEMTACNCSLFNPEDRNDSLYCGLHKADCLIKAGVTNRVKEYVGSNTVCLPSCVEQQISLVGVVTENQTIYKNNEQVTEIQIISPPTVRYERKVTQTKLDLIVGIGSVAGLFFGASLLNLLEIISYFIKKVKTAIFG
nr:uncharacterized protein LOC6736005 isoform X2 [Drosophila simulans]